jgi:hypothetical protein
MRMWWRMGTRLKKYKAILWVHSNMPETEVMKKIYDKATGLCSEDGKFKISRITKVARVD